MMKKWTEQENYYILSHYKDMSDLEIGAAIDRSENAVKSQRQKLNLYRKRKSPKVKHKSDHKITFEDVEILFSKRGYTLLSTEEEYKNQSSKMRYLCPKHLDKGELKINYGHLNQGRGCYWCGRERTAKSRTVELNKSEDAKLCASKGFNYVDTIKENGKIIIIFTCNKHLSLGEQKMTKGNMKRDIKGCKYCSGKFLPEWYVMEQISEIAPHLILTEPYVNLTTRQTYICEKHNCQCHKSAQDILNGGGCYYCGIEKLREISFNSDEKVQSVISKKHPHIKLINYLGADNPESEWYCLKHNKSFRKTYTNLLHIESSGCEECYRERVNKLFAISKDEFLKKLLESKPNISLCGEYKNYNTLTTFYCNEHDCKFESVPKNVIERINCCYKSRKRWKEERMCQLLESWGFNIIRQKTFDDCRDINPLPFDCYLISCNTVVEYDGEGHYFPIKYGENQTIEDANKKLKYTQCHDGIKNKYCKENNINIIRVPYYEFENMENYLFDELTKFNLLEEIKDVG